MKSKKNILPVAAIAACLISGAAFAKIAPSFQNGSTYNLQGMTNLLQDESMDTDVDYLKAGRAYDNFNGAEVDYLKSGRAYDNFNGAAEAPAEAAAGEELEVATIYDNRKAKAGIYLPALVVPDDPDRVTFRAGLQEEIFLSANKSQNDVEAAFPLRYSEKIIYDKAGNKLAHTITKISKDNKGNVIIDRRGVVLDEMDPEVNKLRSGR